MITVALSEFREDAQGRRYTDVLDRDGAALNDVLRILQDGEEQRGLEYAETRFDRPALAGIVKTIERLGSVSSILARRGIRRNRFKMAVGVAVRIRMESLGWRKTGRKGAVCVGSHFSRAEHYTR